MYPHIVLVICFGALFSVSYCENVIDVLELVDYEFVANLDVHCMQCLCQAASSCNLTLTCSEVHGYCGPFKISRVYWVDTGRLLNYPEDDPERNNAFGDCAIHYECATRMVKNYILKYGKDCNGDGVTDCYDFMMLNYNGSYACQQPLEREQNGVEWLQRFTECYESTDL